MPLAEQCCLNAVSALTGKTLVKKLVIGEIFLSYFIDTDLRESKHYIIPLVQDEAHRYMIEFDNKWMAQEYNKKLIAKLYASPIEKLSLYEKVKEVELKGNVIVIYRVK
eukprot:GHVO01055944.1.p1 GENE.GHVO01055944.1~~GHVO01055944.1.p1  ORF type:complete len:109 (+),score=4.64 GHVO01055944.1:272-598(+)